MKPSPASGVHRSPTTVTGLAVLLTVAIGGCRATPEEAGATAPGDPDAAVDPEPTAEPATTTRVLFDGRSLDGWRNTDYGGSGEVTVEDGRLVLGVGERLTGITWEGGDLPRTDYELAFDAAREEGVDFFCGLTFPVGESHASLILGGWGGATTGLSSLDGRDAADNETTSYRTYELGRRYAVRVRVETERLQAWVDGEPVVDVAIAGRDVGIRPEVEPSCPLGVASFATRASISPILLTTW